MQAWDITLNQVVEKVSRQTRRKQRTRQRLLTAGNKLFRKLPIPEVTLADLCEEADLGSATFYTHFQTKDEFVEALVRQLFQEEVEKIRSDLDDKGDPVLRIARSVQMTVDICEHSPVWEWFIKYVDSKLETLVAVFAELSAQDALMLDQDVLSLGLGDPPPEFRNVFRMVSSFGLLMGVVEARVQGLFDTPQGIPVAVLTLRLAAVPEDQIQAAVAQLTPYAG